MVLQTFNNDRPGTRASFIYCVWVRDEHQPGAPLVCIWIDGTNEGLLRAIGHDAVTEKSAAGVAEAQDDSERGNKIASQR